MVLADAAFEVDAIAEEGGWLMVLAHHGGGASETRYASGEP